MVRLLHSALAIVMCCVLSGYATPANQSTKTRAKTSGGGGSGGVGGVIQSVDKDSITVTVHQHKKGTSSGSPETEQKTFKISTKTTVEAISKGQNGPQTKTVTIDVLKPGQHVHIQAQGDAAQKIEIFEYSKAKSN